MKYRIRHTQGTLYSHYLIQRQIWGPFWRTIGRCFGGLSDAKAKLNDIIELEKKNTMYDDTNTAPFDTLARVLRDASRDWQFSDTFEERESVLLNVGDAIDIFGTEIVDRMRVDSSWMARSFSDNLAQALSTTEYDRWSDTNDPDRFLLDEGFDDKDGW